ncbi:MAG: type IV secretion system DNA-binding domain-containing protein [Chlamydiota bacterium]
MYFWLCHDFLRTYRKRGDRVIVLDIVGDFVSEFYREGKDHLFNPYDARSKKWHPWCECMEDYHYQQLATIQIPDHPRSENNYFYQAARSVLVAAMKKKKREGDLKNTALFHWLSTESMEQLAQDLAETPAAVYLDPKGERTTHSIRTTLINALRGFEVFQNTDDPFSLREWMIAPEKPDEWVFLSSTTEQRDQLKVLLSIWVSIAINALKARDPSADNQRTWIIIDELHALQKLDPLAGALAEVRKYNGCLAIATQNFSQLDKLYGRDETSSMIDCCGTKVCFRQGDASIARRMSDLFGKREVREIQKGKSWGANTMGDRESKSEIEREKYTVSPSWILSLPNRAAYIKLPGGFPATKVKFDYLPLEKKTPSYLPRYKIKS